MAKPGGYCSCGGSICEGGKRYTCRGCKRFVPYCFGAADDMPDHCDDCWWLNHYVDMETGEILKSNSLNPPITM